MELAHRTSGWSRLRPAQKESLHMIVHKIHRVLTGNADHDDHWDDMAGYAVLGKPKPKVKTNGTTVGGTADYSKLPQG
jgi:hypothetical protein